jgi:phenylacetaldehyde dehydrogenase
MNGSRRYLTTAAKHIKKEFKPKYGSFVNGEFVLNRNSDPKQTYKILTPHDRTPLCEVENASVELTNSAIEIAHKEYLKGTWSKADVKHRSKVLNNIAQYLRDEFELLLHFEVSQTGRPIKEMRAQLSRLPEWFEYFAALIRTEEGTCPPFSGAYLNYVKRVPLGVCGLLTPWNHPLLIAVKKLAPALAAGNSVVLKPSELAPVSVIELGRLCSLAGVPNGVLNIVPGFGDSTGKAICTNPLVKKIDLTGGTSTGRVVGKLAGENLSSLLTELGGKAPMIIFPDTDLDQAINGAAFASFIASGQTCIMGARLVIHESIYEKFMTKLAEKASRIKIGDPFDTNTQMGPVISENSLNKIKGMVDEAVKSGAKVYYGANTPKLAAPFNVGHYYNPTILGVTADHKIWRDEVFGPVVVGMPFKTEEDAIALANDSPFGLAGNLFESCNV